MLRQPRRHPHHLTDIVRTDLHSPSGLRSDPPERNPDNGLSTGIPKVGIRRFRQGTSTRTWALAGRPALTTIRRRFGSHQPPAPPLIGSHATSKSISRANACRRSSRWRCESPLNGSHGGSIGAGVTPGSGSVCESANTNAERNTTRASSSSSPSSRRLIGIGASTTSPFSPLRTHRPSLSHARKPATRLASIPRSRHCAASNRQLRSE
jgi:hypothetical protein